MIAPRTIPRSVSSLIIVPPPAGAAVAPLVAICFPLLSSAVEAVRSRDRARVPTDDLPAVVLAHPDVGQQHAILDLAAEIFDAPFGVDGADHHLVEDGGILDR